jgi:hypothetical protein
MRQRLGASVTYLDSRWQATSKIHLKIFWMRIYAASKSNIAVFAVAVRVVERTPETLTASRA